MGGTGTLDGGSWVRTHNKFLTLPMCAPPVLQPLLRKAWARKHTQTGVNLSHEVRNLLAGHTQDVKKTQVIRMRFCDYDQRHTAYV